MGAKTTEARQEARDEYEPHMRDPDFMETFKWKQGLPKRFGDTWSYYVETEKMSCLNAKAEVESLMRKMGEPTEEVRA